MSTDTFGTMSLKILDEYIQMRFNCHHISNIGNFQKRRKFGATIN